MEAVEVLLLLVVHLLLLLVHLKPQQLRLLQRLRADCAVKPEHSRASISWLPRLRLRLLHFSISLFVFVLGFCIHVFLYLLYLYWQRASISWLARLRLSPFLIQYLQKYYRIRKYFKMQNLHNYNRNIINQNCLKITEWIVCPNQCLWMVEASYNGNV